MQLKKVGRAAFTLLLTGVLAPGLTGCGQGRTGGGGALRVTHPDARSYFGHAPGKVGTNDVK